MAERDKFELLNDALEGTAPPEDRQVRELLAIARKLRTLPREDFKTRLKAELKEKAMATTTIQPIREGLHTITPYIITTDASRFIDFLKQAFGGEEKLRVPLPNGSIMHAEVKIGDSMIELSDGSERYPSRPAAIHIYLPDADAAYERALAAGATSLHAPVDQPYGDHEASVRDPFGNNWYIATHLGASYIPEGLRTVTPYLHLNGADRFIEFVKDAFGAEEVAVHRTGETGPIVHAKVRFGDSIVEMSEAHGQWQPLPTGLHMYVPDVDAVYERALRAGAESLSPPTDHPYGERGAGVVDPAGNKWFIATPLPVRE